MPAGFTPAISHDGIAFQTYTAGSTGRPKGVRLTHHGMLWSIRSTQQNWPIAPSEVGLVAVPLFHKNAMRGTIKPALYGGATVVIMPRFEPSVPRERRRVIGDLCRRSPGDLCHAAGAWRPDRAWIVEPEAVFNRLRRRVPGELIDALERAFPFREGQGSLWPDGSRRAVA